MRITYFTQLFNKKFIIYLKMKVGECLREYGGCVRGVQKENPKGWKKKLSILSMTEL